MYQLVRACARRVEQCGQVYDNLATSHRRSERGRIEDIPPIGAVIANYLVPLCTQISLEHAAN
jgi:hypothetical protein